MNAQLALDDIISELENQGKIVYIGGVSSLSNIRFEDLIHIQQLGRYIHFFVLAAFLFEWSLK